MDTAARYLSDGRLEKKPHGNFFLRAFLWGAVLATLIFLPFLVVDGGRFLFYGDFNVQQIPFYRLAHDAVRQGNLGWNHLTDLGVNFVGSYSFYLLGSPFFWLTIPFPGEWLQFLMGPLFILKFACATLTGYVFLHRYAKNPNAALLASLLYAFSGFSIYNIFFNHFHEAIIVFPLLLAALDAYMYERRRCLFGLAVAACCIINYYFFVGMVTFTLIYFAVRMLSRSWQLSFTDFLLLALEAVLGLGISCAILVPSVLTITQNYRVSNPISGWSALLYNKNQRYVHILECLFFPPDLPARPNFTPDSESKWASLGAWLPLFSMTGVIGWLQLQRRHWLKKLLWILLIMAFIPGLNASFQLMNASYYARWFYMLTLMMSAATMMALENTRVDWKRAMKWTTLFTVGIGLVIGLMPTIIKEDGVAVSVTFGLEKYDTRLWSYFAIAIVSLAALAYLLNFYVRGTQRFFRAALSSVAVVIVLYSAYFIALGKTQSDYPQNHIIPYALNGGADVALEDLRDDSVRTDFYESMDNSAMFWGVQSIQAFHSIVPGSLMEFYDSIGVQRDVASRPDTTHYALRGLTSVKYLFDDDHDEEHFAGDDYANPAMPGWMYYGNANGFDIWENEYYIPMGFMYDTYITRTDYDSLSENRREQILLKAMVLEDADVTAWNDILEPLDLSAVVYSHDAYSEDCVARAETSCTEFAYDNTGFTARISAKESGPVFFSVPYEAGWSAEVDGKPVEIYRTNVGFMAIRVPGGDNLRIRFFYQTPGLQQGAVITLLSALLLALYGYLSVRYSKKHPAPVPVRRHNMVHLSLQELARKRGYHFARHTLIRKADEGQPDPINKEGSTDD